jgi:Na+/H+-dicarboxylate symporter
MLVAFSTNSSAATMPVSISTAEEKLGVRSSIARFIIPIGATINMDASALYQGLATIFIAQLYAIDLSIGAQIAIVLTAVGASIGTPATPGVGIIILSSVLISVGIPVEGLTLLIGIDRILELFRSSLNVTGDLVATAVMDRFLVEN